MLHEPLDDGGGLAELGFGQIVGNREPQQWPCGPALTALKIGPCQRTDALGPRVRSATPACEMQSIRKQKRQSLFRRLTVVDAAIRKASGTVHENRMADCTCLAESRG